MKVIFYSFLIFNLSLKYTEYRISITSSYLISFIYIFNNVLWKNNSKLYPWRTLKATSSCYTSDISHQIMCNHCVCSWSTDDFNILNIPTRQTAHPAYSHTCACMQVRDFARECIPLNSFIYYTELIIIIKEIPSIFHIVFPY